MKINKANDLTDSLLTTARTIPKATRITVESIAVETVFLNPSLEAFPKALPF